MRIFANYRYFPICLMVVASGCDSGQKTPATGKVTGLVLFQGKPLPGGKLVFVTTEGAIAHSANIEENGSYSISAPVGEVQIGVDNRTLKAGAQAMRGQTKMKGPTLRRPGGEEPNPIKGRYVEIPDKYYSPETSGLI